LSQTLFLVGTLSSFTLNLFVICTDNIINSKANGCSFSVISKS
jgi:hypothetical protein